MSDQVTVTYSLEEVLKELKQEIKDVNTKLDTLQKDVTDLKVGQATLTEKVGGMDKRLEKVETEQATMVKAISDLQGFRSLIVPIVVAVATALLTLLFRLVPDFTH
ncbi:shikimate dehydrogenase [Crocosphaera sp. XPORK-15E]|uniref:shikimate dehydrogenase n=1 Tax=Crocosphaera sp. XPORK-15E TaxID=3110247 RepID=UPI002B1F9578|nr:shikimate dehydrogenase [Crocosphaera sp. XPORK-15E]MEA5535007.1 shikimate dehydrogenase [Crocosphaera sp. XPORK-15E]